MDMINIAIRDCQLLSKRLSSCSLQGDILLAAEEYDDGWMRGLRLKDLEVWEHVPIWIEYYIMYSHEVN